MEEFPKKSPKQFWGISDSISEEIQARVSTKNYEEKITGLLES